MKNKEKKPFFSYLAAAIPFAVFACLLWGSAFPCVKIGYQLFEVDTASTPSIWLYAGTRFSIAGLLIIIIMSIIGGRLLCPKNLRQLSHVAQISLAQTLVQYACFYIGLANTPGVKASILNGLGVIILLAVSALIFRQEKLTVRKTLAGVIGMVGVVLMNLGGDYSGFRLSGEGMIILSIISSCFATCVMKKYSDTDDPVMLSGWQFFVGGLALAALGAATGGRIHPTGAAAYLMILYLAMLSAAAYTLWSVILKYHPVSRIASCKFMIPVFGVILSAILLGEPLSMMCFVSLALVSVSIVLSNREKK